MFHQATATATAARTVSRSRCAAALRRPSCTGPLITRKGTSLPCLTYRHCHHHRHRHLRLHRHWRSTAVSTFPQTWKPAAVTPAARVGATSYCPPTQGILAPLVAYHRVNLKSFNAVRVHAARARVSSPSRPCASRLSSSARAVVRSALLTLFTHYAFRSLCISFTITSPFISPAVLKDSHCHPRLRQ